MQVRHLSAALSASKVLAQQDCGTVRAEALDVIRGIENALVFATPAYGDERHLGLNELAERAAQVAVIAARHSHVIVSCRATSADLWDR
jgi:hypothetical protein